MAAGAVGAKEWGVGCWQPNRHTSTRALLLPALFSMHTHRHSLSSCAEAAHLQRGSMALHRCAGLTPCESDVT